jgi:hypothetical protein
MAAAVTIGVLTVVINKCLPSKSNLTCGAALAGRGGLGLTPAPVVC